jgi:predicted DNA-binding transcriptional regulator YafY
MYISNGKLYIAGFNSEYGNYSSFLVSKIIKIVSVNLEEHKLQVPLYNVQYEYKKSDNYNFELQPNEKIISETDNKLFIEISSENKFMITQRILSLSNRCKVISPQEYKEEIIECLKRMKESYLEIE